MKTRTCTWRWRNNASERALEAHAIHEARGHAEGYQNLSKTEQRFVKKIIDTLLERVAAHGAVACA